MNGTWEVAVWLVIVTVGGSVVDVQDEAAKPKSETRKASDRTPASTSLDDELLRQREQIAALEKSVKESAQQADAIIEQLEAASRRVGKESAGLHPFIREARKFAGSPYRFGGLSSRGIDCSGLILRVAERFGYRVPHSAALLFPLTRSVARSSMKPGDLVFFRDTYKAGISHVGIYLGQDRFMHAAGTNLGVTVSDLKDAGYQRKFVGARRLDDRKTPAKAAHSAKGKPRLTARVRH